MISACLFNLLETESDPFNLIDGNVPDSPLPEPQVAPKLLLQKKKRRLDTCYSPAVKTYKRVRDR